MKNQMLDFCQEDIWYSRTPIQKHKNFRTFSYDCCQPHSKQKHNPSGLLAETVLEFYSWRMRKEMNDEHFEDKLTHYPLTGFELNPRLLIYFLCSIYSDRQLMMWSLSSTTLLKSDWPCHSVQVREQPWESSKNNLCIIIYIRVLIILRWLKYVHEQRHDL